jgi:hypothetical protein
VTFALSQAVEARPEFVWLTRFPEEELDRVSRGGWPILILAILDLVHGLQRRFAATVAVLSSAVRTPEGLVAQWNEQYGR